MTNPAAALDDLLSTIPGEVVSAAEIISLTHRIDDETARELVSRFTNANGSSAAAVAALKNLPFVSPAGRGEWKIAAPTRQVLAERCYERPLAFSVDELLADKLASAAQGLPAASPPARQLQWRSIYHRLSVNPHQALCDLDAFVAGAAERNSLSDFYAAANATELREPWLTSFQVEVAFIRGRSAYAFQDFDVAERHFMRVWNSDADPHRRIVSGHLLGVIWAKPDRRESSKAERVLKEASILAQETGDEYGEAVTLTSLGALQHRVGGADRLRDAERNLRRSASLARGSSGIGEGMALGALGAVLLQKGTKRDLEEAEKVLRRALELLPQDAQRVAEDRLSRVLQRRGGEEKLAEAEEMVKRRLIKGGGDLDTAITLNMLAQILLRRGDTAALRRAREASDHSVRLGRELSNKRHLAMALLASAYIAEKLGEGERALASLEEVVALNRDLGLTQQARRAEGSLREMKARLRQQGRQAK